MRTTIATIIALAYTTLTVAIEQAPENCATHTIGGRTATSMAYDSAKRRTYCSAARAWLMPGRNRCGNGMDKHGGARPLKDRRLAKAPSWHTTRSASGSCSTVVATAAKTVGFKCSRTHGNGTVRGGRSLTKRGPARVSTWDSRTITDGGPYCCTVGFGRSPVALSSETRGNGRAAPGNPYLRPSDLLMKHKPRC